MLNLKKFLSRGEWLEARKGTIGGSDAGVILGLNPYKSNVDLWEEMTGRKIPDDVSENPAVKYGTYAEAPIRELFALDHPEFRVAHMDHSFYVNPDYPFAHASLDGVLTDASKNFGILEIKTAQIRNFAMRENWTNRIPDTYYAQLLFYFGVTGAKFAFLRALIKEWNGWEEIRDYYFDRDSVLEEDVHIVMDACADFYDCVRRDERPALLLPEI